MKKFFKPLILIVIFSFLGLYFIYNGGYSESRIRKEKELMEEMILKYEEDLASGIDVTKENYIIEKPDYSNVYTDVSLSLSSKISDFIDQSIKFVFEKINDMVSE